MGISEAIANRRSMRDLSPQIVDETTIGRGIEAERLRSMLADPAYQIFHHAPAPVLICGRTAGSWITADCALAAENLMLMAHALGLGSCWIAFAQGYLNTPAGKQLLGLPRECVPAAPIILGHPRAPVAAVPRKPAEVRWPGGGGASRPQRWRLARTLRAPPLPVPAR